MFSLSHDNKLEQFAEFFQNQGIHSPVSGLKRFKIFVINVCYSVPLTLKSVAATLYETVSESLAFNWAYS
jgi:hypothetical protein